MVRHQPLQYYEPQLCLSCLTGIYGCRWKRYQRSHDDTTPWERLWFLLLVCTFSLTLTWLYFWWGVHNDYDEFNWYLYNRMGYWSDWSVPILVTSAAAFTYIAGLLVLALCHIAVGQQLNLHWIHKMGLVVILASTVVAMSAVAQLWEDEWEVLLISLQGTAPFLHIGALVAITALSWIVAGQFARAERSSSQLTILCTFFAVVFTFYLIPLTISSPCIMEKKDLGPKPALIGHRGAPMLAPEHTVMSFRKALEQRLYGLQADITISLDGVPFLMHDTTLRRTTNVEHLFPELARRPAAMLNWTVLQRLNAGQWFLKTDPFWTASSLSPSDHREVQNQSICSLAELLELAKGNASLLLNLRDPPRDHPYRGSFLNVTLEAVLRSGFPQHQVMWLFNRQRPLVRKMAPGFQQTSGSKEAIANLRKGHIQKLNLRYTQVSHQELRDYASWNLSVNLYTVNAPWLFSLLWCAGVPSVTSDNSHTLSRVPSPLWIMPPDEYCLMWVTADLISFSLIIGIFVLQNYHLIRWRLGGIRSYNPEQIMLSAAVRRTSRDVSIMKEKLIFSEISDGVEVSDELSVCSDSSYDTYANANSTATPVGPRNAGSRANFTLRVLFHQVIDIDMEIIVKLDEVHRRLGFNLVNDLACPLGAIFFGVFHMFTYQAIYNSFWLPVCWRRCTGLWHDTEVTLFIIIQKLIHVQNGISLISNVKPGVHDRRLSQDHPPPFILRAMLTLKHVFHCFANYGISKAHIADSRERHLIRKDFKL